MGQYFSSKHATPTTRCATPTYQSSLRSSCANAVAMVTSTLNRSLADGIAVPPHLQRKAQVCVDHFDVLTNQADQWAERISHTLGKWQKLTESMERLKLQLPDLQSELSGLVQVEEFLMELTSLESRLSVSWISFSCLSHLLPSPSHASSPVL